MRVTILLATALILGYVTTGSAQTAAEHTRQIDVTVLDAQGLPLLGARVTATQPAINVTRTATSATEKFSMQGLPAGEYTVRVSAPGFQFQEVPVDLRTDTTRSIDVRLKPATIIEELVVTPTRSEQRVADVPASITVVSNAVIERSPAVVADDVLRQVPTFSLFRRTSSIAANPTAQGVSLRGIGPSGVSRTLVMLDNVPFNDPFGGWVYWTRVPMMNAEQIEVVDGATSSLYGNYAMGGVINIVTNRPTPRTLIFKPQYGNRATPKMDLFASDVWGKLGATLDATVLNTDGYKIVAPEERGAVDNEADVRYRSASGRLEYAVTNRVNVFFRAGVFDEKRNNGKIGELNDTNWKYGNGGARANLADGSNIEGRLFVDREHFHQNTFAVPAAVPPRSQSNLTLDKIVPTNALGFMSQWSRPFSASRFAHIATAGVDFRNIDGDSDEQTFAAATGLRPIVHRVAGGTQNFTGFFAQDIIEATPKLQLTLAGRLDHWSNYDAHNLETTIATGLPTAANRATLPDKSNTAFSPRGAVLYRATNALSVWASVSRGFRAPTLKELYSPFRVGNVQTNANEALGPERLTSLEGGVSASPIDRLSLRATIFQNRVTDPIANVTISSTPALVTRQLRNLGSTNIAGFQADIAYRPDAEWTFGAAYVFDVGKVHESLPDVTGVNLTGKYLAEVPKHRASFQATFNRPEFAMISLDTEFVGHQFDDDLNTATIFPAIADKREVGLPGYAVVNLTVSRAINPQMSVFFGAQNLFDTVYYVGTNPTTIGTPRLVNGGIRLRVGR